MDKDVIHINNKILLTMKRNEFDSVVVRWMNLQPVIQSEVSQKEKNKYYMLMQYVKSRKMVLMNLSAGKE